ncbi:MAG: methyltransferase domain-containing protein [Phycisphaerae bacterium]|nr:methyltransferase domain-containing protein [Phycisphaerae bacterium]
MNQTAQDYSAKLNIEGTRGTWIENRRKIDYVLWRIQKHLKGALTACDIGVGDGYLLTRLNAAGLRVTGIDISSYSVNYLRDDFRRKGLDIRLIEGDISNIKLEENQFDIVTCLDVLEHIPGHNLRLAIETLTQCIVNGGLLIGTLPFREDLSKKMVMCPKCRHKFHSIGHFHSFQTSEEITKLLEPEFTVLEMAELPSNLLRSNILTYGIMLLKSAKYVVCRKKRKRTICFVARLSKS